MVPLYLLDEHFVVCSFLHNEAYIFPIRLPRRNPVVLEPVRYELDCGFICIELLK